MALSKASPSRETGRAGEFTAHEEARALLDLKLLPDLPRSSRPRGSMASRGRARTPRRVRSCAGSGRRKGAAELRAVYAGEKAGRERARARIPRVLEGIERARARGGAGRAAICRAGDHPQALRARGGGPGGRGARRAAIRQRQAQLWQKCTALEPDDPRSCCSSAGRRLAAGNVEGARRRRARARRTQSSRRRSGAAPHRRRRHRVESGRRASGARRGSKRRCNCVQPEAAERALTVRLWPCATSTTWPALRPLLTEADTGPEVLLALRDLDLQRAREGSSHTCSRSSCKTAALGRRARATRRTRSAAICPGPSSCRERACAESGWHLRDQAAARAAFIGSWGGTRRRTRA